MSILGSILASKTLSPWQEQVKSQGRACPECSLPTTITAPVSDDADMLRLQCDCGWIGYEFPPHEPTIIEFESLRHG